MNTRQEKFTGTKTVQEHLKLDASKLEMWLNENIDEFEAPLEILEFKGGQSNPTYCLETKSKSYVLRRKPPGKLLPSAHAVDREFRVIEALHKVNYPVPRPYKLCMDEDIIGTIFYVMEKVEGRIFWDLSLPDLQPRERTDIYQAKLRALTQLQKIDYEKVGLQDFGKTTDYMARQIHRWTKIYHASETTKIPYMDKLNSWLPKNIPETKETCIIHGDYRLDNMIIDPIKPDVIAVLDWELTTLGDPVADFVNHLVPWYMPALGDRVSSLEGFDLKQMGIPTEEEYIEQYCRLTNRESIRYLNFYKAYCLWRLAAIYQGIIKRVEDGTAASADATTDTEIPNKLAARACNLVET